MYLGGKIKSKALTTTRPPSSYIIIKTCFKFTMHTLNSTRTSVNVKVTCSNSPSISCIHINSTLNGDVSQLRDKVGNTTIQHINLDSSPLHLLAVLTHIPCYINILDIDQSPLSVHMGAEWTKPAVHSCSQQLQCRVQKLGYCHKCWTSLLLWGRPVACSGCLGSWDHSECCKRGARHGNDLEWEQSFPPCCTSKWGAVSSKRPAPLVSFWPLWGSPWAPVPPDRGNVTCERRRQSDSAGDNAVTKINWRKRCPI